MKYFIPYLIGLLAVLVVALLVNDIVWCVLLKTSTGSSACKVYRIYGHHPSDEIPVFGSSRAQTSFDPELISSNCFNYGISGSVQNEILDEVEKYVEGDTVESKSVPIIINLDPWGFPGESYTKRMADYGLLDGLVGIRSFGKSRAVFADWLNERIGATRRIVRGAALVKVSRGEAEWDTIYSEMKHREFSCSEFWKGRIRRIAELTPRPIYWVVAPCAPRWKAFLSNGNDLDEFCRWLSRQPHQHVINLYSSDFDNSCFMDPTHLNIKGARKFSSMVRAEMVLEDN